MDIGTAVVILASAALVGGCVFAAVAVLVRRIDSVTNGHAEPAADAAPKVDTVALARTEDRLHARDEQLITRAASLDERERLLTEREADVEALRDERLRGLEAIAGLGVAQARTMLLKELEDKLRQDQARLIRDIENETKREADRRVRNILSVVMQRMAAGHAAETTVSVVHLPSDDMKGRIIGREGRNIRALEHLTGVDFIIDDTPHAVVLSGFDGVRREIARLTLEKLLQDGRIHPARIV